MTSEHKIFLPDAPAPDAEARQAAIATALRANPAVRIQRALYLKAKR